MMHDGFSQMMFKITDTEKGFPLISVACEPCYQWEKKEKTQHLLVPFGLFNIVSLLSLNFTEVSLLLVIPHLPRVELV